MKVLDHGFVELRASTPNVGLSVVDAARCSFGSSGDTLGERDRKLIKYLLGNGHTSPFRHAYFTFHIKAPLFVFRQWWKHQVGSAWRGYERKDGTPLGRDPIIQPFDIYTDTDKGCSWNELSGRYKVMEPEFYLPVDARANDGKQTARSHGDVGQTKFMRKVMDGHNRRAVTDYENMLHAGIAKELARLVLPPSIYSECYWTVSLQAVLHFLDQRLDDHAQFEIRQYAEATLTHIKPQLEAMGIDA